MYRGQGFSEEPSFERGKNYCLIIGIDNYTNGIAPLKNCVADAIEIKKVLTDQYQFSREAEYTKILLEEEASRGNILQAIESFKEKMKKEDNLVITFSGHGDTIDGTGYWLSQDSTKGKKHTYVSTVEIITELEKIVCHHLLLIVDACFSGSIFKASARSNEVGSKDEQLASRLGLSASHSREVAIDGKKEENSPFAKYLIEKLRSNDQSLSISELAAYVKRKVKEDTRDQQNPIFHPLSIKGHDFGEFFFHPNRPADQFELILDFVAKGQFEEAKKELKDFCQNSKDLPDKFTWLICELKQKISKEEENLDQHFELREAIRIISNTAVPPYILNQKLKPILVYISQNRVEAALSSLENISELDDLIRLKVILFRFRFSLINHLRNSASLQLGQSNDLNYLYDEYVRLLLLLIKIIDLDKTPLKNDLKFSKELLLQEREIGNALILLKDHIHLNHGDCDELYLLNMLEERDLMNRHKFTAGNIPEKEFNSELNNIRSALEYLISRAEKKKIQLPYLSEEFISTLNGNDSDFTLLLEQFLKKGNVEGIIQFLKSESSGQLDFFTTIIATLENIELERSYESISIKDYYASATDVCQTLLDIHHLLKAKENLSLLSHYRKDIDRERNFERLSKMTDQEKVELIGKMLRKDTSSINIVGNVLDILSTLKLTTEQQLRLRMERLRYDRNMEFQSFTSKSNEKEQLVSKRADKVHKEAIKLFEEFKTSLKT